MFGRFRGFFFFFFVFILSFQRRCLARFVLFESIKLDLCLASSLFLVHRLKQLLWRDALVFGDLGDNKILLLDDLVSCEVVDKFVVLAWERKGVFQLLNLLVFLLNDLLKTKLDRFPHFELVGDKVLVLVVGHVEFLVDLGEVGNEPSDSLLVNLDHSGFLFNKHRVLNFKLLYLPFCPLKVLFKVVNHSPADLELAFINLLVFQQLFDL